MTAAPLVCLHFGSERHNTPRYSDKNPPFQRLRANNEVLKELSYQV